MAFIVKQNIHGKDYYYLRKSFRKDGKVISKHVAYLGKTKKEAEKRAKEFLKMEEKSEQKVDIIRKFMQKRITIEELAKFCKEKGFIYRSSDIYGGFAGFWDFGPLGIELFNNLKKNWWNFFVHQKENMVGMEGSIISHPRTWKASGHIENFNVNDYLVVCKKCKKSNKIDKPDLGKIKCEFCGGDYDWENARMIEQMFKTKVGTDNQDVYLRGETAQGMFLDFKLISQTSRQNLPFGIAQIGRCFRNEIAPRDFLFRSREFHIGEFEFFINPEEKKCELLDAKHLNIKFNFLSSETQLANSNELEKVSIKNLLEKNKLDEWHAYWLAEQLIWFKNLGLNEIRIREHTKKELSHYSSATFDIDYEYPFGLKEIAGNANRGQFDLTQHQNESKESMEIFDEKVGKKVLPRVIEPTFGIERVFLALLTKAYCEDDKGSIILNLPAKLAPIKAAIFPIVKQPMFEKIAQEIFNDLKKEWNVIYDKSGSIGRRYARNDEIGTPFCVTVDEDSIKNETVTIRERNSAQQFQIKISELKNILQKLIDGEEISDVAKKILTRKKI